MKKLLSKIIVIVSGILIVSWCSIFVISHAVYHRSFMATVAECYLRITNKGDLASTQNAEAYMKTIAKTQDEPYSLDTKKYKSSAKMTEFKGTQMITFGDSEKSSHTVLFLHGGAYVNNVLSNHLDFCDKLSQKTNAYVMIPLYPLAPNNTYDKTFNLLTDLYTDMLTNKQNDITIMGDSAGGGLSIAFCEYLNKKGLAKPEHLIGLSPWVDISMTTSDYEKYQRADPSLGREGLIAMGKAWAGELDTNNYLVSPINGDVSGLPDTTLFVGTRELFYPDVIRFYDILQKAGVKSTLITGEGLNHVYPLFPIPEAKEALNQISNVITNSKAAK